MFVRSRFVVPLLGEAGTHLPARCLVKPDRETEKSRPLETWPNGREAEWPRPLDTWPTDRVVETLGDLTETAEDHSYLADGLPSP